MVPTLKFSPQLPQWAHKFMSILHQGRQVYNFCAQRFARFNVSDYYSGSLKVVILQKKLI